MATYGLISGAGTNLKVGGGAPVRSEAPENFFGRVPSLFGSKSTISRFGERFRDGQYSLVSFLFLPPCPAISKSGARVPVPHEVGATAWS